MLNWSRKVVLATGVVLASVLGSGGLVPVAEAANPVPVNVTTTLDSSHWTLRVATTTSRKCSTEVAANSVASGTKLTLKAAKVTKGATYNAIIAKAKKATKKKTAKKACPYGAFTNGALGTAAAFTMTSGTVEANIKFPVSQGMHGSLWLKSTSGPGEIDLIESYGHGYGLTSGVYTPSKNQTYVAVKASRSRSWWAKAHTYSVSWGPDASGKTFYQFKVDGVNSFSYSSSALTGQQFEVVASLLTSDWELKQLKHPVKRRGAKGVKKGTVPSTMVVNWVKVTPTA